jgi:hypothetical protein
MAQHIYGAYDGMKELFQKKEVFQNSLTNRRTSEETL